MQITSFINKYNEKTRRYGTVYVLLHKFDKRQIYSNISYK